MAIKKQVSSCGDSLSVTALLPIVLLHFFLSQVFPSSSIICDLD